VKWSRWSGKSLGRTIREGWVDWVAGYLAGLLLIWLVDYLLLHLLLGWVQPEGAAFYLATPLLFAFGFFLEGRKLNRKKRRDRLKNRNRRSWGT
jgi:hypothetical protein